MLFVGWAKRSVPTIARTEPEWWARRFAPLPTLQDRAKETVMLTFYFAPGSSSMAAHIALHEVGAAFEGRPMSFKNNDMKSADFRKINPDGKVPTLLIDGRVLTEVAGILFYLAKRFPEAGLLPDDIEGEAQAVSWMSFIASTLHPARQKGIDHVRVVWAIADQKLGSGWALGERYSIADIHLFRLYWRLFNSRMITPGTFPNLDAHYERMMARPAVRRTIADETAVGYELPA
jgi:glutathione S-transferase